VDWSTKKFNYRIVDENGKTIAFINEYLGKLENFVNESNLHVKRLERTGPDDFIVEVSKDPGWKI